MEEELQQTEADKSKKEAEELKAKIAQQKEIKAFNARVKERYNQYQGSIRKYAIGDSNMQDRTIYYEYNMVRDDYKGVLSGENPFKQKPKPKLIEATLLSVHDGDTGWFQIGNEKPFKVRFANVHAREVDNPVTGKKGEKGGIADKEFLLSKIPIGTTVGLASNGYDSYDRKVMSIYHGDGLNERLDVTMAVGGASQPADNYTSSELEWYKINRNKFIPNTNGEYVIDGAYNIPKPNGTKPAIVPTVPVQNQPINSPMPVENDLLYPSIDTSIGVMPLDSNLTPPIDTMPVSVIDTMSVDTLPLNPIDTMPIDTMGRIPVIDTMPLNPMDTIPNDSLPLVQIDTMTVDTMPAITIDTMPTSVIDTLPQIPADSNYVEPKKEQTKKRKRNPDFNMVYPGDILGSIGKNASGAIKGVKNALVNMNKEIMLSKEYEGALKLYDNKRSIHENLTGEKLTRKEYWDKADGKDVLMFLGVDYSEKGQAEKDKKVVEFFKWMGLSFDNFKETLSNDYRRSNKINKPVKGMIEENKEYEIKEKIDYLEQEGYNALYDLTVNRVDKSREDKVLRNLLYWERPKDKSYIENEVIEVRNEGLMIQKKYGVVISQSLYKNMSKQPIEVQRHFKRLKKYQEDLDNYNRTKDYPNEYKWIKTDYAKQKELEAKKELYSKLNEKELEAWYKLGNYGKLALLQKYNVDYYWLNMDLILSL